MKKNLYDCDLMTIVTTVLLGIIYPFVVTGLAQVIFPRQANGEPHHDERQARRLAPYRPAVFLARLFSILVPPRRAMAMTPAIPAARISAPPTRC